MRIVLNKIQVTLKSTRHYLHLHETLMRIIRICSLPGYLYSRVNPDLYVWTVLYKKT
jgi:hypothetical protein